MVFVDSERLQRIRGHLSDLPGLKAVVVTYEDRSEHRPVTDLPVPVIPFSELIADAESEPTFPDVSIEPEDDATIFYTSGTTGKPKGAVGTHRNICTNLMSLFFINTRMGLREGSSIDERHQDDRREEPVKRRTCCRCRSSTRRAVTRSWSPTPLQEASSCSCTTGIPNALSS